MAEQLQRRSLPASETVQPLAFVAPNPNLDLHAVVYGSLALFLFLRSLDSATPDWKVKSCFLELPNYTLNNGTTFATNQR